MKRILLPAFIFLICSFLSSTLKAQLKADFSISSASGCMPMVATFTNTSTGGTKPYQVLWDFGDGDTSTNAHPSHTYDASGTYKITMLVRDAGFNIDTISKNITVFPLPKPDLGPDRRGCWGHGVLLTTAVIPGSSASWTWISATDTFMFKVLSDTLMPSDSGKYIVTVHDSNGCAGTDTVNVFFNPPVIARKVDTTVCVNETITLQAGLAGAGASYTWIDLVHNKTVSTGPTFTFLTSSSSGFDKQADLEIVIRQTSHGVTCADTGYYNITVNTPTHSTLYKLPSKCISDPAFQLVAGPPFVDPAHQNGYWFYPRNPSAIVNNYLYPAVMGVTDNDPALGYVHYHYENSYHCVAEDSIRIIISGLPPVSAGHDTEICHKNGKYLLSNSFVSPPGGSWFPLNGTPKNAVVFSTNRDSVFFDPNATGIADSVYGVTYAYHTQVSAGRASCSNSDTVFISVTTKCVSGIDPRISQLSDFSVYPNPFSSSANIRYTLLKSSKVSIALFDITGKQITVINNEEQAPGEYQVGIDAEKYHLTSGVYLLKFMTNDGYLSRHIVKL